MDHTQIDISCYGQSDGNLNVTISGGTAPYSFDWSPDNYDGQHELTDLPAGSYMLSLSDSLGCMLEADFLISEPDSLSLDVIIDSIRCYGGNEGKIDVCPGGGTSPYQLSWQPEGYGGQSAIDSLSEGIYILTLIDQNQCERIDSFQLLAPDSIAVFASIIPASSPQSADGAIFLDSILGGTPPLSFSWSPGGQTSKDLPGILPGTYTLTITDANDCEKVISYAVDFLSGHSFPGNPHEVRLFPNPTDGAVYIDFSERCSGKWGLHHSNGTLLKEEEFQNLDLVKIEKEGRSKGVHVLKIWFSGERRELSFQFIQL